MDTSYICSQCNKQYSNKFGLTRHIISTHSDITDKQAFFRCCFCDKEFKRRFEILNHYTEEHNISIDIETMRFNSYTDFFVWKKDYESRDKSAFIIAHGSSNLEKYKVCTFICARSGNYKHLGDGIRHSKQGSKKINGYCPAQMKVSREDGGTCILKLVKTHVGHENMDSEKDDVQKLSKTRPFNVFCDSYRLTFSSSKEISLLSNREIKKIVATYNLEDEYKDLSTGSENLDAWVNQIIEKDEETILIYKAQGTVIQSNLSANDFVLGIMNPTQCAMLQMYGSEIICVDQARCLNACPFELITLSVIDETKEVLPCSFLFCNRVDQEIMTLFFCAIKKRVCIQPKIFMSDTDDFYYNAWINTISTPSQRFYCSWYADEDWRKKIAKINPREKREEIYKVFVSLQLEHNTNTFDSKFEEAVCKLISTNDTKETGDYLLNKFGKCVDLWAYCYRTNWDITVDTHFENLHRCLKHIYLLGKDVKRLDKIVSVIMKFFRGKFISQITSLHKKEVVKKTKELRERHLECLCPDTCTVIETNGVFKLRSARDCSLYEVSEFIKNCDCGIICSECKSCIHLLKCTCEDSSIMFNMCVHAHLICLYKGQLQEDAAWQSLQEGENATSSTEMNSNHDNKNVNNNFESEKAALLKELDQLKNKVRNLSSLNDIESFKHSLKQLNTTSKVKDQNKPADAELRSAIISEDPFSVAKKQKLLPLSEIPSFKNRNYRERYIALRPLGLGDDGEVVYSISDHLPSSSSKTT